MMLLDKNGDPLGTPQVEAAEALASGELNRTNERLKLSRIVLNADEMASLTDVRPRLEKDISLRQIEGNRMHVYLFSIDGTLNGNALVGCLFAGECMMVTAKDFPDAYRLAREGLASTIELMRDEFAARVGAEASQVMDGLSKEAHGRRMRPSKEGEELRSLPKMKAIMAHMIGGLPWRF